MPYPFQSIYFDDPPQPNRALDLFLPDGEARPVALLFVHGGGWGGGARGNFHGLMRSFSARGYACGSVDYRLGGTPAWDQVADVRLGHRLFTQRLAEQGLPQRTVLVGSSAGGHLALLAGMARRHGEMPPAGIAGLIISSAPVTFEPWDEIFPPIWQSMQKAAGQPWPAAAAGYRELSPLTWVDGATPPILLLDGANEHMFPRHVTQRFIDAMARHERPIRSRVYEHAEHGFFYSTERRCQQAAFDEALAFLASLG